MAKAIAHEEKIENIFNLIWKKFKKHRLALFSLGVLIFLITLSLLGPFIEKILGISHLDADVSLANLPAKYPHILGTNEIGQDVFLRIVFGGRISLSVGILSALTGAIIGSVIGLLAGYFGGKIDAMLMRFTDAMLSIPILPLMIVFAALDLKTLFKSDMTIQSGFFWLLLIFSLQLLFRFIFDGQQAKREEKYFASLLFNSLLVTAFLAAAYLCFFYLIDWQTVGSGNFSSVIKLILIIVFFGWMPVARLARAGALALKNMEFVQAARSLGASNARILLQHIFPNALAPIIVTATLEVGGNILYEAALSFLGLGIQPPVPSWGNMLNNAVDYIKSDPSLAFWPGLFILVTVAAFNFLGDGLRDALDPHQVMKDKS